jgi:bifunctional non-homologous end joining protein LigD
MPRTRSLHFVEPMMARNVDALPGGEQWGYEVKLDGYRALLVKDDDRVHILSRNNNDLTTTYPNVALAATRLTAGRVILDGELVALDPTGRPSFQALQHRRAMSSRHVVVYYAFDLLHLDGRDLRSAPLTDRRALLSQVVNRTDLVRLSHALEGDPGDVIQAVRQLGLEGVVAKRCDSKYESGERSGAWVKLKLDRQQEFVVGGYRPGNHGVDALLVGYYEEGALHFAGKVRAGFTPHLRAEVFRALKPLHTERCPFVNLPSSRTSHWGGGVTAEQMAEMQWVKPRTVAQIRFVEWTADHHLRHAAFLGLRTDKAPSSVDREGPGTARSSARTSRARRGAIPGRRA